MSHGSHPLDAIYRAHAPSVFRRARRLLGSDADADDAVAEVFTSLFERPEQYQGRSSLSTFLYAMTTHACLTHLRTQTRRLRLLQERAAALPSSAPEPAADVAQELRRLLREMPPPLGELAVYYYLDQLTHEEIAEVLGCSRRTVGKWLVRLQEWTRAQELNT